MSSTAFSGADVEALHDTAAACAVAAQHLILTCARTTRVLCTELAWKGPDADAARSRWHSECAPAIAKVADRVREAGLHLIREAEQQRETSTSAGGGVSAATGAASSTPAGSAPAADGHAATTSPTTLADRLATIRDTLTALPGEATLGKILAELPQHGDDWLNLPDAVARVGAEGGWIQKSGGELLGIYGTVTNADGLATDIQNGDAAGAVEHGVPLMFTAMGPEVDATLGVAWGAGYQVGTVAYNEMQGTRYGDIVQSMTDDAFEQHGAWGMLQVPGILGFAAYEYATEDPPQDHTP